MEKLTEKEIRKCFREGYMRCPCCGKAIVEFFCICPVCGWQNEISQALDENIKGDCNEMTLKEAQQAWKEGKEIY